MHDPFYDQSLIGKLKWIRIEGKLRILSGQRIGWEQKTEILHELAEMSAEGYLSQEEWEVRKDHVEKAQTQDQLDIAMQDLQTARSSLAAARARREREAKARKALAVTGDGIVIKTDPTSFLRATWFYGLMWTLSVGSVAENIVLHQFAYGCIALFSMLIFSILLIGRTARKL